MLRTIIHSSIVIMASSVAALAADLPNRAAPPTVPYLPPSPAFSWTGVYLGGQIGYQFGRDSITAPGLFSVGHSPNGVVGGAHIGFNYQVSQFIVGFEGDVNGSSYSGSVFNPVFRTQLTSRIPVDGSLRGRIGAAWDRVLVYATGGAAFASIKHGYIGSSLVPGSATLTNDRVGWTVGGGVEYAMTDNWSVRVDYRYTDYGNISDFPGTITVPRIHHETNNRVQAGFSYKFDTSPPTVPIVAKY
ncbi:outer membrane protein [Beijerinckia indica]|uniref:Porin n=1 Tax=Beijerinckia indica subsp. indica (strain ATCC 9039 / DSM 1715 / NCIMB 8712) TaxID=395963 RepID=B2IBP5_BEII9|nr:outer membrane protein [Beijerinckia indica]ACB93767.1 porin [Beijerinckia indica subsp. indica ATCC 9039]